MAVHCNVPLQYKISNILEDLFNWGSVVQAKDEPGVKCQSKIWNIALSNYSGVFDFGGVSEAIKYEERLRFVRYLHNLPFTIQMSGRPWFSFGKLVQVGGTHDII